MSLFGRRPGVDQEIWHACPAGLAVNYSGSSGSTYSSSYALCDHVMSHACTTECCLGNGRESIGHRFQPAIEGICCDDLYLPYS